MGKRLSVSPSVRVETLDFEGVPSEQYAFHDRGHYAVRLTEEAAADLDSIQKDGSSADDAIRATLIEHGIVHDVADGEDVSSLEEAFLAARLPSHAWLMNGSELGSAAEVDDRDIVLEGSLSDARFGTLARQLNESRKLHEVHASGALGPATPENLSMLREIPSRLDVPCTDSATVKKLMDLQAQGVNVGASCTVDDLAGPLRDEIIASTLGRLRIIANADEHANGGAKALEVHRTLAQSIRDCEFAGIPQSHEAAGLWLRRHSSRVSSPLAATRLRRQIHRLRSLEEFTETPQHEEAEKLRFDSDNLDLFSKWLKLDRDSRLVDVCGSRGAIARRLLSKVGATRRSSIVDVDYVALDRGRATAKKNGVDQLDFRPGSALEIPLPENYADATWCGGAFDYFIHSKNTEEALGELRRITKPGGRILINHPMIYLMLEPMAFFDAPLPELLPQMRAAATAVGLHVIAVKLVGFYNDVTIAPKDIKPRYLPVAPAVVDPDIERAKDGSLRLILITEVPSS